MIIKTVMIVTPFSDFGDLVSQSIRKNYSWNVNSVTSIKALASDIYNYERLDYAVLDMEMGIEKVRKSAVILREKFPGLELILVSKKAPPEEVDDLHPWRLLSKPFVEKDLLEIFQNSSDSNNNQVIDGEFSEIFGKEIPIWARDKNALKNILVNTISSLDVQEAIIYAENTVLVQNKNIQEDVISDCSSIISKYMDVNGQGELIKQIRFNSDSYLLHATILAVGFILALLYSPDTSYKNIRHQTRYIATKIVNPQLASSELRSLTGNIKSSKRDDSSKSQAKGHVTGSHLKTPGKVHPSETCHEI